LSPSSAGSTPGTGGPRRLLMGNRPLLLILLTLVALMLMVSIGPLELYLGAKGRVEDLAASRDRLTVEVDALAQRRAALENPDEIELIARAEHGYVRPGEIPFVVVTPESGAPPPEAAPAPATAPANPAADEPWYRRLGGALAGLFD